MKKKILGILLSLIMVFMLVPNVVLAEEGSSSNVYIFFDSSKFSNWEAPFYVYIYDEETDLVNTYLNDSFPGQPMKVDPATGYYYIEVSDNSCFAKDKDSDVSTESNYDLAHSENTCVIISDSKGNRYPTEGSRTNLQLGGSSKLLSGTTTSDWNTIVPSTITYNLNGGTINSGNVTVYINGQGAVLPTDVTKAGYTFAGWYADEEFSGVPVTAIGKTDTGNKEFYAKWNIKEIELIEINNATVSFKADDKPVFTGAVADDALYVIEYEGWFGDDGEFISSNDYWNSAYVERGWCDGLISSFKENTKYTYQLYLKLTDKVVAEGYVFGPNTRLKVNGKYVEYTHSGETSVSLQIGTELTMTPTVEGTPDYKIIDGANGSWTQNSDGMLTFRANGDFSKFTGVNIDDTLLDAKNYTAVSGSTVITLNTNYLKTLSVGTHKLTVVYTDGECSTNFEVKQAVSDQTEPTEGDKTDTETPTGDKDSKTDAGDSAKTGDATNLALWIALMLLSGAGIGGVILYTRRKRTNE